MKGVGESFGEVAEAAIVGVRVADGAAVADAGGVSVGVGRVVVAARVQAVSRSAIISDWNICFMSKRS